MTESKLLHVGICTLQPLRVVFRQCVFGSHNRNYDSCIRQTFQFLREWIVCMGLNPADLLRVGIPVLEGGELVTYTCCMEYALPFLDENSQVSLGELPGGRYAVMRVEKTPAEIRLAIRQFNSVYMQQEQLVRDENRPVYEIYHERTMEYCVPVLG